MVGHNTPCMGNESPAFPKQQSFFQNGQVCFFDKGNRVMSCFVQNFVVSQPVFSQREIIILLGFFQGLQVFNLQLLSGTATLQVAAVSGTATLQVVAVSGTATFQVAAVSGTATFQVAVVQLEKLNSQKLNSQKLNSRLPSAVPNSVWHLPAATSIFPSLF